MNSVNFENIDLSSDQRLVDNQDVKENPCAICRGPLIGGGSLCGHIVTRGSSNAIHLYHSDCISEWLKRNQTCPACRANVGNAHEFAVIEPEEVPEDVSPEQRAYEEFEAEMRNAIIHDNLPGFQELLAARLTIASQGTWFFEEALLGSGLCLAVQRDNLVMVQAVLDRGRVNHSSLTDALSEAIRNAPCNGLEIVRLLLRAELSESDKRDALAYAEQLDRHDVAAVLRLAIGV